MKWAWIIGVCCVSATATDLAGPESCRPCHPKQYSTQSKSQHFFALRPILNTPLPGSLTERPLRERSGISFEYERAGNALLVSVIQAGHKVSARLEWAFGSGAQAITPVGIFEGRYFEHRISYYTAASGARRTLGHPGMPSSDPVSALGIPQSAETIFRCFNCHATGVRPGPDLREMIAGVTCERCHGPAADHAARGLAMRKSAANRDVIVRLCGECHRLPSTNDSHAPEVRDPLSIRFAPVGLMASRCYKRTDNLGCLSCHNPHEDANKSESYYVAKCLGCHERQNRCKAGKTNNCVGCHMQRRSPAPHLTFTDHRIRVYRTDEGR